MTAEELYESIGGDLCSCQRIDVPSWCEKCQWRIGMIANALRTDDEVVVAMLAAQTATLRHLWDIAGRFNAEQCNKIRDEIHILNKITLPAIKDLQARDETPTREWLMRRVAFYAHECERQREIIGRHQIQDWRTINTAPQDGSWFLAWGYDIGFIVYRSGPGLSAAEEPDPTHWMPLPAPPQLGDAVDPHVANPGNPSTREKE